MVIESESPRGGMDPGDVEETVDGWLRQERLDAKPRKDERANFHHMIRYPPGPHGHTFAIVHPKGRDLLAISSMTRVDSGQQNEMEQHASADLEGWQDWMHGTRISLIESGVDWGLHVGGDKKVGDGPLQAFNVSEPIWLDGLTKNSFMQTLRRLWLAKLSVIHDIKHSYGPGSGKPGKVDDFENKGKPARPAEPKEVETDDSGSFGTGFDASEWA